MDDVHRLGESQLVTMIFNEVMQGTVFVTPLGKNLYQLDETVVVIGPDPEPTGGDEELWWGDTIEAESLPSGALCYRAIAARGPWRHWSWILPRAAIDSDGLAAFTALITKNGGRWERIVQGILIVHLPEDVDLDPDVELADSLR